MSAMAAIVVSNNEPNEWTYSTMAAKYLTNRADFWWGSARDEVVYGLGGDDYFKGYGGNDELHGGKGDDVIYGGKGNDRLYGEDGTDSINADAGNDTVWGGAGDDYLNAGDGSDIIYGGNGNDGISDTDLRHDFLNGGDGDDYMSGLNDTVDGGGGNDQLRCYGIFGQLDSPHTILIGGEGSDFFKGDFWANGVREVVEIKDFDKFDQEFDLLASSIPDLLQISGSGEVLRGDPAEYGMQVVGHDLVFTVNGAEQDQLIVRGAADWLHVA